MIEKIFKDIHYQRTPWVKSHSHTGKIPLRKDPSSLRTGSTVNVKWRPLSYIIVKGGGRSNFFRLLDRFDSCQPFSSPPPIQLLLTLRWGWRSVCVGVFETASNNRSVYSLFVFDHDPTQLVPSCEFYREIPSSCATRAVYKQRGGKERDC